MVETAKTSLPNLSNRAPHFFAALWNAIVAALFIYLAVSLLAKHGLVSVRNSTIFACYSSLSALAISGILLRKWRRQTALGFFFFVFAFYAFEFLLTTVYYARSIPDGAYEQDKRSKLAVVRDFRAQGIPAVPAYSFGRVAALTRGKDASNDILQSIYFGGIPNRKTVLCNETGEWITFQSGDMGFNNPAGIWENEILDVVVTGDSNIQGHCIPEHRTAAALVRERIPGTVNLGLQGADPLIELGLLKEFLSDRKVGHVFLVFYEGNDNVGLEKSARNPALLRYLDPTFSQGVIENKGAIAVLMERQIERALLQSDSAAPTANFRMVFGNFRNLTYSRGYLGALPTQPLDVELLRRTLGEARRFVEERGGIFTLVYLPSRLRYLWVGGLASDHKEIHAGVVKVANELQLDFLDGVVEFSNAAVDQSRLFNSHISTYGNQVLADMILKRVGK